MGPRKRVPRNKALDAVKALRDRGAATATFHPDGSLASVSFPVAAPSPAPARPAPQPVDAAKEILASPLWPKTDIDGIDGLPDYDKENGN